MPALSFLPQGSPGSRRKGRCTRAGARIALAAARRVRCAEPGRPDSGGGEHAQQSCPHRFRSDLRVFRGDGGKITAAWRQFDGAGGKEEAGRLVRPEDLQRSNPSARQSVEEGNSVSVRVDLGGRRIMKKQLILS